MGDTRENSIPHASLYGFNRELEFTDYRSVPEFYMGHRGDGTLSSSYDGAYGLLLLGGYGV